MLTPPIDATRFETYVSPPHHIHGFFQIGTAKVNVAMPRSLADNVYYVPWFADPDPAQTR